MDVVLAHEVQEVDDGCYHLLREGRVASLCGQVNEGSPFASDSSRVLSRQKAREHGLDLCALCRRIADER